MVSLLGVRVRKGLGRVIYTLDQVQGDCAGWVFYISMIAILSDVWPVGRRLCVSGAQGRDGEPPVVGSMSVFSVCAWLLVLFTFRPAGSSPPPCTPSRYLA